MKITYIETTQDMLTLIGFMRRELNSYYFDKKKTLVAPLRNSLGEILKYLPNKIGHDIRMNVKLNAVKAELGKTFETIRTKKSGEFNIEMFKGMNVKVSGLEVIVETKDVIYKSRLPEKTIQDGIYTRAGIGMTGGKAYLIVHENKRKHLTNRYIHSSAVNIRKKKVITKELLTLTRKLKKGGNVNELSKKFTFNILSFLDTLSKTFCNVSYITEGFTELSTIVSSQNVKCVSETGENQAGISNTEDVLPKVRKYLISQFKDTLTSEELEVFTSLIKI